MRLTDAVVLVVGASGGIGSECAGALGARGARVMVHGRDADRLDAVAADVGAKAIALDLTEPDGPERLVAAAREVHGRIDAVVHCEGVGWLGPIGDMPGTAVDELIAVNLTAPVRITRAVLGEMSARGSGHITFLASIAGWTGVANEALYAATKAAVITFADSLRIELAGSGIGVSVVSPAAVRTEFFDRRGVPYERRVPRPVSPQRVAEAVIDAVEHDRAHRMMPSWLALAPAVRAVAPGAFRWLNQRFGTSGSPRPVTG